MTIPNNKPIKKISKQLSAKITSGEIINNQASVVKELVENSIDADSTQIDISLDNFGFKKIMVSDNGIGMSQKDAKLAFDNMTTSKINTYQDLINLTSLGFRGQALASIGAVSKVTLKTSLGTMGSKVYIQEGHLINEEITGSKRGTVVTVEDIFTYTPQKFDHLGSNSYELSKVIDIVNKLALSHPQISFSLQHNGRNLLRTSGNGDIRQVIGRIYGPKVMQAMLPLTGENASFSIKGYISPSTLTRSNQTGIIIFMNGRYIKSRFINTSIVKSYQTRLMVGRFPIAILNITSHPQNLDVNVLPSKEQIKINKEQELNKLIHQLISHVLFPINYSNSNEAFVSSSYFGRNKKNNPNSQLSLTVTNDVNKTNDNKQLNKAYQMNFDRFKIANEANNDFNVQTNKPTSTSFNRSDLSNMVYLNQFHGMYLLGENATGLYIFDQHAVQERINYEKYTKLFANPVDVNLQQELLVPIILDYSVAEALLLEEKLNLLNTLGVKIERFGKNSFIMRHHPIWFPTEGEDNTLKEMLDWLLNDQTITLQAFREKTIMMMSCKRSLKANQFLDKKQGTDLIKQLAHCQNPYNCPHGRPTMLEFSNHKLEKLFKRIPDSH